MTTELCLSSSCNSLSETHEEKPEGSMAAQVIGGLLVSLRVSLTGSYRSLKGATRVAAFCLVGRHVGIDFKNFCFDLS
jgi:hypothetical protein